MCSSQVIGSIFDSEPNGIHPFPIVRNTNQGALRACRIRQVHWGVTNCTKARTDCRRLAASTAGTETATVIRAGFLVVHLVYVAVPFV